MPVKPGRGGSLPTGLPTGMRQQGHTDKAMPAQFFAALAAVLLLFFSSGGANAEEAGRADADDVRTQLADVLGRAEVSQERRLQLEREVRAIDRDTRALNNELVLTARRIGEMETQISHTLARLARLEKNASEIEADLVARQDRLARLIAALQRISRNPPPAFVAPTGDVLSTIRASILLNSVMPELDLAARSLAMELQELSKTRAVINEERDLLEGESRWIGEERERLAILVEEKQLRRAGRSSEIAAEARRLAALRSQARSLSELLAGLDGTGQAATEQDRGAEDDLAFTPAISFAAARGRLIRPVEGRPVAGFGMVDRFGETTEGERILAPAGALVRAPADGWIAYGDEFQNFGNLIVLNTGDGYHILLAGMAQIDVAVDQFVLAGEPIGRMGDDLAQDQSVLYIEFRENGLAIDPSPWWQDGS